MDWLSVLAVLALLVGIAGGGALVVRSPSFWVDLATEVINKALPLLISYVLKRKSPEEEKKWREEYSRSRRDRTSD